MRQPNASRYVLTQIDETCAPKDIRSAKRQKVVNSNKNWDNSCQKNRKATSVPSR
jgi:hypothetical protein